MPAIDPVWRNLATALGAEAREYPMVVGASGIEHHFVSLAMDEVSKRLILISADPDPRLAALVQSDVQSALPDVRVLVARPVALDLAHIARELAAMLGTRELSMKQLAARFEAAQDVPERDKAEVVNQLIGAGLARVADSFSHVQLPVIAQVVTIVQQAASLDWSRMFANREPAADDLVIPLDNLLSVDNLAVDRQYGVCPIPLYELTKEDWALFASADDIEALKTRLRELRVYQYFFPNADELAIDFIDRGLHQIDRVEQAVHRTDALGHKVSSPALVDPVDNFRKLIDELREKGFVLPEIEAELEVGPEGAKYRMAVRSRPQEGLIDKVFKRSADIATIVAPFA